MSFNNALYCFKKLPHSIGLALGPMAESTKLDRQHRYWCLVLSRFWCCIFRNFCFLPTIRWILQKPNSHAIRLLDSKPLGYPCSLLEQPPDEISGYASNIHASLYFNFLRN